MQRLIFSITSGRSGTGFLTRALSLFPEVLAEHEPLPGFHEAMRLGIYQPEFRRLFLAESKLPFIAHKLQATGKTVYAETSHLFGKGFVDPLLQLGVRPDLILLSRDVRKTALSLFRLNTIPGRNYRGLLYYKAPEDPDVLLRVEDPYSLTPYQCCYWYVQETRRRQQVFGEKLRSHGARVLDLSFEEMVAEKGLTLLSDGLGLSTPTEEAGREFERMRKRPVNAKGHAQQWVCPLSPEELAAQETALEERICGSGLCAE